MIQAAGVELEMRLYDKAFLNATTDIFTVLSRGPDY
jgi:hypothetical protein